MTGPYTCVVDTASTAAWPPDPAIESGPEEAGPFSRDLRARHSRAFTGHGALNRLLSYALEEGETAYSSSEAVILIPQTVASTWQVNQLPSGLRTTMCELQPNSSLPPDDRGEREALTHQVLVIRRGNAPFFEQPGIEVYGRERIAAFRVGKLFSRDSPAASAPPPLLGSLSSTDLSAPAQQGPLAERWASAVHAIRQSPQLRDEILRSVMTSMEIEGFEVDIAHSQQLLEEALDGPPLVVPGDV